MRSLKEIEDYLKENPEALAELREQNLVLENRVSKVGSAADIDSDIHTAYREELVRHVGSLYGEDTIANIGIEGTFLIKKAIKALCTIYSVPPALANKVTKLLPRSVETGEVSLLDVIGPEGSQYEDARDFREATSSPTWKRILESAAKIDGKISNVGQHACGVIMSSRPLTEVIPLTISKDRLHRVTQWTYPELESLGLIKMDFLGLDTVDIIMNSVANIQFMGKEAPPSMLELIHGPMDDKKTYEMLSRGETTGIFQLGGAGVKDLLKRMSPTSIDHIAATTALYRPGPMGMNSHTIYAERSSGREDSGVPVHKDFVGSPLEEILKVTYNLCVFQEQITQIANQICGWTIREGDDLRKAMGKKKMSLMLKMKPRFIQDGIDRGYSEEAMSLLWETIESFGQYAFNRSHSYAYAINAYQAAWLKANYQSEFMAALMEQNYDRKEKITEIIKEAKRLKLSIGGPSVNSSIERIVPTYKEKTGFDIVYGLASLKGVPLETATGIIKERETRGEFKSVRDFFKRINKSGVPFRKNIYQNLCYAGAFDCLGVSRKAAAESYDILVRDSKKTNSHGANLFSILGDNSSGLDNSAELPELLDGKEFSFVEKLKLEAKIIGLYLSGHPLERVKKKGHTGLTATRIKDVLEKCLPSSRSFKNEFSIVASVTDVEIKRNKTNTSIILVLDDGEDFVEARLAPQVVKSIEKHNSRETIKSKYLSGAKNQSEDLLTRLKSPGYAIEPIEPFEVYKIKLVAFKTSHENEVPRITVTSINKLQLSKDGLMPYRIRLKDTALSTPKSKVKIPLDKKKEMLKGLSRRMPGDTPVLISEICSPADVYEYDGLFYDALTVMNDPRESPEAAKKRTWPPKRQDSTKPELYGLKWSQLSPEVSADMLTYKETDYRVEACPIFDTQLDEILEDYRNYDMGVYPKDQSERNG